MEIIDILVYIFVGFGLLILFSLIGFFVFRMFTMFKYLFKGEKKIHELHPSNTSFTISQGNESNKKQ